MMEKLPPVHSLEERGELLFPYTWLDYFRGQPKEQQLREIRRLCRLKVRPNGRFAELKVGQTMQYLAYELEALKFVEDPLVADPENRYDEDPSQRSDGGTSSP